MNGLLRRLAASAAGSAVTLRSDARLPYGGTGFDWNDGEPSGAAPRAQPVQPDTFRAAAPQVPPLADPQSGVQRRVEPRQRAGPAPMLPGKMTGTVDDGVAPRDLSPPPQRASVAASPAPETDRADPPALIERSIPTPSLARPAVLEASLAQDAAVVSPPPFVSRNDPAPLLPQTPRTLRNASASDATAPPQAVVRTPAGDDTEVHIHIGRIEVTAVHEPAPPVRRRAAAAAPAPMSLDSYLARRRSS